MRRALRDHVSENICAAREFQGLSLDCLAYSATMATVGVLAGSPTEAAIGDVGMVAGLGGAGYYRLRAFWEELAVPPRLLDIEPELRYG